MDLMEQIGSKKFGYQYKMYAVKLQSKTSTKLTRSFHVLPLRKEFIMYQALSGGVGIPRTYAFSENSEKEMLVMDMLGESLDRIFHRKCHGNFSVKTVLMLAEQMLTRYQFIHERGFIHRDVKANNFVMGLPGSSEENTIFVVDFNLSKSWNRSLVEQSVSYIRGNKNNSGINVFESWTFEREKTLGRKHDLEGLGYLFLHFLGFCPWKSRSEMALYTRDLKAFRSKLYQHKVPTEFVEYLDHTRTLNKDQDPNYDYLRGLFRNCAKKLNITFPYDNRFDWYKK